MRQGLSLRVGRINSQLLRSNQQLYCRNGSEDLVLLVHRLFWEFGQPVSGAA